MGVMTDFKKWLRKLRKKNAYKSSYWAEVDVSIPMPTSPSTSATNPNVLVQWVGNNGISETVVKEPPKDLRVEKKPVEVVKEILMEKPEISFADLGKQIKVVEKRMRVFKEQGCSCLDEQIALRFLKARKKSSKSYKKFAWPTTTDEKIRELCSKYKLRQVAFQSYAKNVPMEAVDELEKYVDLYESVSDEKPTIQLIIDDGGMETKKDPILLAGSPFGRWYHILGAWDKEVEYVDDLVYKGK